VVGHRTSLGEHSTSLRKCSQVTEIQVSFDDGETSWFASTDPALRIMKQKPVGGARRVSLRCALSLQPLVDPARGEACTHDANCNYNELRAYVARKRQCPVAGCDSAIPRSRDIVRDLQFRDSLLTAVGAGDGGATFGYWDPISGNFELDGEMHARASMPKQPRLAGRCDELSRNPRDQRAHHEWGRHQEDWGRHQRGWDRHQWDWVRHQVHYREPLVRRAARPSSSLT